MKGELNAPLYGAVLVLTEAWTSLIRSPQNRAQALNGMLQELGARLVDMYFYYGEWDGFVVIEAPDDTTFVASLLAGNAPGHLKATKISRLYTADENPRDLATR